MIDLAVIGAGSWGKNLVRSFYELCRQNTVYAGDLDVAKLERLRNAFPFVENHTELFV